MALSPTAPQETGTETKTTEELVGLIRGFFATPVIAGLGRLGAADVILHRDQFTPQDFSQIPNKKLLAFALDYLTRIALLTKEDPEKNLYRPTELGRQVFQRLSSFFAPHSYREYLHQFHVQLQNAGPYQKQEVDRLENIIGSGRTHERYFPPAVSFLRRKVKFKTITDIGCGDGRFLEFVLKGVPGVDAVGIDLSEVSVKATRENLQKKFPDRKISTFAADGANVSEWSTKLLKFAKSEDLVLSMWFLLHEISRRDPQNVKNFLLKVHELFPKTPLVICELVRQDTELLVRHRKELIMPEYVLFHDISEQGVLSWPEYQKILKEIPYQLAAERLFDEIGEPGAKEPATFVWCLTPK